MIIGFNNERIRSVEEFLGALRDEEPGEKAKLKRQRGKAATTVTVTLAEAKR